MDFASELFQPYNTLFAILVIACGCYWIMVVTGFFGLEVLDLDVDMDVDLDMEVDATADASDLGSVGIVGGFLRFMHFHEVPFMIVVTILSSVCWILFSLLNFHWNVYHSWTFAMTWIVPTVVASLPVSKVLLQPFVKLFRAANIPDKKLKDYVGEHCVVTTSEVTEKFGTAEIATDESPLVIQIRNPSAFRFHKGDKALLAKYVMAGQYFEIRPLEKEKVAEV